MPLILFADLFTEDVGTQVGALRAMPVMLAVLCILAIAYRYYSAFLAAKVATLDDQRITPAHTLNDGQNYHPTKKWVLFGHHFAAISGAGPLIGPVLAIQYGYMPGLLWLVIGVCLAGAVQDMLVLAASVRRNGKSLAEIARTELGPWANIIVSAAILFIVVIALAGLGAVVVKALGGEEIKLPKGMQIAIPEGTDAFDKRVLVGSHLEVAYYFPENCKIRYAADSPWTTRPEKFRIDGKLEDSSGPMPLRQILGNVEVFEVTENASVVQAVKGSSWGTFTIACTIPRFAFFIGLYMYKIRKGQVLEASLIGAVGVLAATVAGNWIPDSPIESWFLLTKGQTVLALTGYGFIASVLPVWLLLCPRDYLSSFLKIGTIILLVVGVLLANPVLRCPPVNHVFQSGGPTFPLGGVFPFVFICIMCGAISGFHALVASGTTPKMIDKESHIRPIGYGAMLIEGLVGVVALIAAASLDPQLYYDINVDQTKTADYQSDLDRLYKDLGIDKGMDDRMHQTGVDRIDHLKVDIRKANLAEVEQMVGNESLRGRTGGAVTLAVGMALIFTEAFERLDLHIAGIMKYWYHFAIMFEALFILTTIDTGTRIARFLLQETLGKIHPKFEKPDWLPGAVLSTFLVTAGWGILVQTGSIDTIWPMFGIANQLLAVIALCIVTTLLINSGRAKFAPVTLVPMLFVLITTMTAGGIMVKSFMARLSSDPLKWSLNLGLTLFVMLAVALLLVLAVGRWLAVLGGMHHRRDIEIKKKMD